MQFDIRTIISFIDMTLLIIVIGLFIIIIGSGIAIVLNFSVPSQKHYKTPKDEGIDFEEVSIPTCKKKHLFGWWMKADRTASSIILMHGWGKNAGHLMPYIKNLHGKGMNLLVFDSRNHGNSDRDNFSSMVKFAEDIYACVDFIEEQPTTKNNNIFLIGMSIGGAASIYAAANDTRIKKIITIGAPSSPEDIMAMHLRKKHFPQPLIWLVFQFMQYRIGKRFSEISSDNNISKSPVKLLLIHGKDDEVVPFSQAEIILNAANPGQAEIWAIEGKGHNNCHYEVGIWERCLAFLQNH